MKVELGKIGSISHGVVLNRVKPKKGEEELQYPLLTISRLLSEEEGLLPEEAPVVPVGISRKESLKLAKEGMILVGLTSFHRAVVLSKEHEGMLISSNFLILEFPGGIVDPHYFAWYFNEHPAMEEKKEAAIQGESKVKVLSIRLLRSIEIDVPSLVSQMAVGNLYDLQIKKERLMKQRLRLEKRELTAGLLEMTEQLTFPAKAQTDRMLKKLDEDLLEIEKRKRVYEQEMKLLSVPF